MRSAVDAFGADRCCASYSFFGHDQTVYDGALRLFWADFPCAAAERGWIMGGTAAKLWRWRVFAGGGGAGVGKRVPPPASAAGAAARPASL